MGRSPHALASSAGVDVLRAGGSAVDAAIAASAVLSGVYPHMRRVGGGGFWVVHGGRRRAAALGPSDWFRPRGRDAIPLRGIVPATLTVPGAVDTWCEAHA